MEWIVYTLAVWRITNIIYDEKIFEGLRNRLKKEIVEGVWVYPDTFIGDLFSCFWCLSVWVSFLCLPFILWCPELLYPFALSAGAIGLWQLHQPEP